MKKIFLEKYFPASRVANIRKEICGIRQSHGETLSEYWEILFKENLLHGMEPRRIDKNYAFAAPFKEKEKEKEKAFNLTCSSSTPFGFMPTQTIWNSLR